MFFRKSPLVLLFLVLSVFFGSYAQSNSDSIVRVLAIGNSFSQDAVEQYLHELADASGKKMIIGNLYIGGAPLSLHWENVQGNKAAYSYRKITVAGDKHTIETVSILSALQDESWDYISLQQASPLSGMFDTYVLPLKELYQYADSVMDGKAKFIWHQTWAYAANSTHQGFANYRNDQLTMYKAIAKSSAKAKKLVPIALLVPSGTAVQNARTSFLGDRLTRDGYHLNLYIGRYIAACTWFESLFGQRAPTDKYRPENVSEAEAEIARQAVHAAARRPFKVTKMKFR